MVLRFVKFSLYAFAVAGLLSTCSTEKGGNLPPASGVSGDMYIIMDSAQWKGELGAVLDSILSQEMMALPRPEPIFKIWWVNPKKLNPVLKQRRNLIFAVTFDQRSEAASLLKAMYTNKAVAEMEKDTSLFIRTVPDVYAKRQQVMYLFGMKEKDLVTKIRQNASRIVEFFNKTERERLTVTLFAGNPNKGYRDVLRKDLGCEMKIPFGYRLVMNNPEFFWIRQMNPKDDRNVFVYRMPYTSPKQFERDSLIRLRNRILQKYVYEDPERLDTYLETETSVSYKPVLTRTVTHNQRFATEMQGLWRSHNLGMGGPFISLALVDNDNRNLYYVEGFVYGPSRDLRELIREVETVIYTLQFPGATATP
ncbi:MAG: DUF4837 family protein [Cyclobacteriaceae bacterium]|jgi:hypothetical protein|nr:DUF4837 family protein [Cyclobacteriaceae bacterium]